MECLEEEEEEIGEERYREDRTAIEEVPSVDAIVGEERLCVRIIGIQ